MFVMRKQLSHEELDAMIIRTLARLPSEGPSRSFANRVMDRVQMPPAGALVLLRRARAWAAQPRRAVALAGSYAVLAAITLGVVLPWLNANAATIRFAANWVGSRVMGLVSDVTVTVAGWYVSSGAADVVRSLPLSGAGLWIAGVLVCAAYAGCAVGLHLLLRAPRGKNEPVKVAA
jgi:hypothetical protein